MPREGSARARSGLLIGSVFEEQIALEQESIKEGAARYREAVASAIKRGDGAALRPVERLMWHWSEALTDAIRAKREACRSREPGPDHECIGPALDIIEPESLAVIVMHETIGLLLAESAGVMLTKLTFAVGRAVVAEINMRMMLKTDKELYRALAKRYKNLTPQRINWWASKRTEDPARATIGTTKIGGFLVAAMVDTAMMGDWDKPDDLKPAFTHEYHREKRGNRKVPVQYLTMTDEAMDAIDDGHRSRQHLRPRYLPMLIKPFRWDDKGDGGYVHIRTPFVSKPTNEQKAALAAADLSRVNTHLGDLTDTGWRINRWLYDVQVAIWDAGGGTLGIPRRESAPIPPRPAGFDRHAKIGTRWNAVDPKEKDAWKVLAHDAIRAKTKDRALRREWLRKRHVADMFKDREAFWFPHQLDFRSRAYAIPPHLNHYENDVSRGILEFSESKPATSPEAIEDIKIHAANLYGFGGLPFEERISWIDANMEMIRRSVADPIGQEFWQHADESSPSAKDGTPWQFLAACRALVDGDAASRLPVRRDGSCNGLQHYAALGRDPSAAFSVNLTPSDRPNSVYLDVAAVLKGLIEHDAKVGTKTISYRKRTKDGATEQKSITIAAIAEMTLPFINKKTVKQPVMTSVYDVTRVGATTQILGKLEKQGLTDEAIYAAARHLAERTEQALATICASAARIMAWLRDCGQRIADKDRLVTWTTPIGFPVVQPYRKMQFVSVRTLAGRVKIPLPVFSEAPLNKMRHIRGIAPNFVHSLDATHMFMVASACHADGIAFAAVHDGYLTHAATCRAMVQHTLEQFVKLHARPILDDLVAEFRTLHPDIEFEDPPERGDFDINDVLRSKYLFS